jgi:hypothetical protein
MRLHGSDNSDVYLRISGFAQRRLEVIGVHASIYECNKILDDGTCLTWATKIPSLRQEIPRQQTSVMGQIVLPPKYKTLVYFEVAEEPNRNGLRPVYLQLCDALGRVTDLHYLLFISQDKDHTIVVSQGCKMSEEAFYTQGETSKLLLNLVGIIVKDVLGLPVKEYIPKNEEGIVWH